MLFALDKSLSYFECNFFSPGSVRSVNFEMRILQKVVSEGELTDPDLELCACIHPGGRFRCKENSWLQSGNARLNFSL